jgi:ACS family tartrate transporter-like MFS transporter
LPTTSFARIAAAASIGAINTLGTLGAFAGPCMMGSTNETGEYSSGGLYPDGGTLNVSATTIVARRFARKATLPQDCQTGKVF